ncbi:hypothetical protein [Atlantibacter hermannii]|uniref:hypothetical protein n=1 Tax=Atlantibacter hermannii TaxID=565 RepID=UPI0028AECCBB|nr:hypothetical protein [Atlantibacter hermannii]
MNITPESINAEFDLPVARTEQDRYGCTGLAKKLARSIISLDRKTSTVIGIEGKWGAG